MSNGTLSNAPSEMAPGTLPPGLHKGLRSGAMALLFAMSLIALVTWLPSAGALREMTTQWLASDPPWATPLFLLVATGLTALGVSRQGVALAAGFGFGAVHGTLVTLLALLCACAIVVPVARTAARPALLAWFPQLDSVLQRFVGARPFLTTLALRLLPVGSNIATNVAAGVAGVRLLPFLAASALGYLPQTIVFALAGHGVGVGSMVPVVLGAVLLLVSTALAWFLWRMR